MTHPYREPAPRRRRRGTRRLGTVAIAVGALWLLGVARLAYAAERGESVRGEPALAALLTVAPPVALVFRSTRALLLDG